MSAHKFAIIDCGTNTFHLLICEKEGHTIFPYFRDKVHVKIGEGGIEQQMITDAAFSRAMSALEYFKTAIDKFDVEKVYATATSSIRNAVNGKELVDRIKSSTGIDVQIISGEAEAYLIYKGVSLAHSLGPERTLIVDIGGGSVECIIADHEGSFWCKSYEIGAQRLLDRFHKNDPMRSEDITTLRAFLDSTLHELIDQCKYHRVSTLVGSSGSFDTLYEMYARKKKLEIDPSQTSYQLSLQGFASLYEKIIRKDRTERLQMPGMAEARVDMIVVAVVLIEYIVQALSIDRIVVSAFALKEGIMHEVNRGIERFDLTY